MRPGAVAPRAAIEIRGASDGPALASFTADTSGGFEVALAAGHALEGALVGADALWLVARDADGAERRIETTRARGPTVEGCRRDRQGAGRERGASGPSV